jgi:hypothetical protein
LHPILNGNIVTIMSKILTFFVRWGHMLVSVCFLASNLIVHAKPQNSHRSEIQGAAEIVN